MAQESKGARRIGIKRVTRLKKSVSLLMVQGFKEINGIKERKMSKDRYTIKERIEV